MRAPILALLTAALPSQSLVWTFQEQQAATCGRVPHPAWDPALAPPTFTALGGGLGLTWLHWTPGAVAFLFFDVGRTHWAPMVYVRPTHWNLSVVAVAGTVAFNWTLPASLPLPGGMHYAGAGQVVALCPGTVIPCESSYTFDVWCRR